MQNKLFLKAADICELLEVKQTSAYEIIGNLNKELEEQGYLTLTDCYMSAFGGMEQSESLISTKGGMCHEYKSNIPLFSRNGMRYVQFLSYSQTAVYK